MSKWMVAAKKADFEGIGRELNIDPVIVRIMRNRDMTDAEQMRAFLHGSEGVMHDPFLLPDMDKAVKILRDKIEKGVKIRIIGDYDVDGVTATVILYKGLKVMGADVSYAIPNRITDGYGINENMIGQAHSDGVDTILTCDNGIAATGAIKKAKAYGMTCVVTDHHEVPYIEENGIKKNIYPEADAVVDPKIPDCGYPYPGICGAFVAYKLITALAGTEHPITPELDTELRELAGLATVCDVMELRDENRSIVSGALKSMRDSRNVGIRALRRVCEIENKPPAIHQLGFIIGPCINATGRLDSADLSVELLLSESMEEALPKASELRNLNELRKGYTEDGEKDALKYIENEGMADDKVLIIYLPDTHESLAGIVAGRIKERYYRPTVVFTDSENGIKGSGRSIEAYNMYDELNKCRDLFTKFGGHAMAAGLSLPKENLPELRKRLAENCTLTEDDLEKKIMIDVPMPLSYVTERLIGQMSMLEPFGTGNPKPVFATKDLNILNASPMGKTGDMCRIKATDATGRSYELIMFNGYEDLKASAELKYGVKGLTGAVIDVIYYPDINEYRGMRSIQYIVSECRLS